MRDFKKTFYVLVIFALLLNLMLPSTLVNATEESGGGSATEDHTVTGDTYGTVTGDVYGIAPAGAQVITENIITEVTMWDKVPQFDTDGKVTNGAQSVTEFRPQVGSQVAVYFKWKLKKDHTYKNGSTFTFKLPDQFGMAQAEPLTDLTGEVGQFDISLDGTVTFYFNQEIEDNSEDINGYFYVFREFSESNIGEETNQDFKFIFPADVVTIPVHFESKATTNMDKIGIANKTMNPNQIEWSVTFNNSEKSIKNAVLQDELPSGLVIDDINSVQVYKLKARIDGTVTEDGLLAPTLYTITPTPTPYGFKIEFGNIDHAYRVKYTTRITQTIDTTYPNKATVTGDNLTEPLVKTAGVQVKYSKPLGKSAIGYDTATQTITWKVEYNYNEKSIDQANATLTDEFDSTQQLVGNNDSSFEVYKVTIGNDGKGTRIGSKLSNYSVNVTPTGFTLQFNDNIDSAYEIIYKTTAKERVYSGYTVKNKVTMPGVDPVQGEQPIREVIFKKEYNYIHYDAKEIEWKLTLNEDKKTMTNVIVTDSFADQALTFKQLQIANMTENTDYTLTVSPGNDGFKIEFTNPVTDRLVITYKTTFDARIKKPAKYKNGAVLTWKEPGVTPDPAPILKYAEIPLDDYSKNNGNKTGTYNAKNKEITWTIDVNYNLHQIDKAVVWDFYTAGQTLVDGYLEVRELTLTGSANGVSQGSLVPATDYVFEKKTENGLNGIEIRFNKKITTAYRIIYKTSLGGERIEGTYSNHAKLFDADAPGTLLFDKQASVTPKNGGEFVSKNGCQGGKCGLGNNPDLVYWQVFVNRSQSQILKDSILTDIVTGDQFLLKDSFKLYKTSIPSNNSGTVTKASDLVPQEGFYEITFDKVAVNKEKFTLKFLKPLDTAYVLEYQSFINADNGETISNKAEFEGTSSGAASDNGGQNISVAYSGAGGGATTPGRADITVLKVEAGTLKPLAGATFELRDASGQIPLETQVTDNEGKAVFKNYKYKNYKLIETVAPPGGYLIHPDYASGKVIEFKSDQNTFTVANEKITQAFELTKVDKDELTKLLAEAKFKLQVNPGTGYEDVVGQTNLETNTNGSLLIPDMAPGQYQLIEIEAPKGYKLDPTPIMFTITQNQTVLSKATMKNEIYHADVELTKVDAFDNAIVLAGAEFDLQDSKGTVLQSKLTTNASGKLTIPALKAGSYQFVETKAPANYELDPTPLKFEVLTDATVKLQFGNHMSSGSMKLTKIHTGRPDLKLAGAQFRLLDKDKKVVKDKQGNALTTFITNVNGELTIPDLRPGKYFIEEIQAPSGYTIKNVLTEFTVVKETETKVTVENDYYYTGGGGGGGTPTEPGKPTDPEKPTEPGKPTDPEKPTEPGKPTEPAKPTDPEKPTEPGTPTKPGQPDIKENTPKDTPKTGQVNVPKDGTTEVGKQPEHGKVTVSTDGNWQYKPDPGFTGKDKFSVIVKDKDGNEEEVFIDIDVDEVPLGVTPDKGKPNGGTLPKTGEDSPLPLQLAGVALILAGIGIAIRKTLQRRN